MTFLEALLVIIAAVAIGALFYFVFKSTGPWGTFWTFLLVLILAGLVAEAWITPFGPVYYGIAWVPTLFVIILFALLLAAATPSRREEHIIEEKETRLPPGESRRAREAGEATAAVVGIFFWFLIIFLFVAAFWGLFYY
ncbi:MAG: hypothetical protein ACOC3T_00725 [Bacteroidota bacterium]